MAAAALPSARAWRLAGSAGVGVRAPSRDVSCPPAGPRESPLRARPTPPPPRAGTHNLAVLNAGGTDGGDSPAEAEYKNWAWADARLTELGKQQAAALAPRLAALPLDVMLTSPLSRAIQTAMIAAPPGTRFEVEELVRERNGTHPCDKRRTRAELAADFPTVDLKGIAEEDDTWTEAREPFAQTVARAEALLAAVARRPETYIGVATHNDWLQALLLHSSLKLADESLRRKFDNADAMSIILTWEDAPAGAGGASGATLSSASAHE